VFWGVGWGGVGWGGVSEGLPAIMRALDLVCTIVAGMLISSCLVGVQD